MLLLLLLLLLTMTTTVLRHPRLRQHPQQRLLMTHYHYVLPVSGWLRHQEPMRLCQCPPS